MHYNYCALSPPRSAVLENHHVAFSFKLTEENKGLNIYQNLDRYCIHDHMCHNYSVCVCACIIIMHSSMCVCACIICTLLCVCSVTYRNLRSSIIDLVMATDMAKHFEHLAKFNMYTVSAITIKLYSHLQQMILTLYALAVVTYCIT